MLSMCLPTCPSCLSRHHSSRVWVTWALQFLVALPPVSPEERAEGHTGADPKAAPLYNGSWARNATRASFPLCRVEPYAVQFDPRKLRGPGQRRSRCLLIRSYSSPASKHFHLPADLGVPEPERPGHIRTFAYPWSRPFFAGTFQAHPGNRPGSGRCAFGSGRIALGSVGL